MTCNTPKKLELHRHLAGELSASEVTQMETHFDTCTCCSEYFKSLSVENTAFLEAHPFEEWKKNPQVMASKKVAQRLQDEAYASGVKVGLYPPGQPIPRPGSAQPRPYPKSSQTKAQNWWNWIMSPGIAGVAVATLALALYIPWQINHKATTMQTDIRYKGVQTTQDSRELQKMSRFSITAIHRDGTAESIQEANSQFKLTAGDSIQIVIAKPPAKWISLASIDGRGTVSMYCPDGSISTCSHEVTSKEQFSPNRSLVLDDAPSYEIFFAIHSEQPIENSRIMASLGKLTENTSILESEKNEIRNQLIKKTLGNVTMVQNVYLNK